MNTIHIVGFSILLLSIFSCEEDLYESKKRIVGSGATESESIVVNEFSSIDLENVSNVYVKTGKERKVVFTAYENILPYMSAQVIGDELLLKFNEDITVSSDRELRVDIMLPTLDKVTLSGVGNFIIAGPSQRYLEVDLDGVGNVNAFDLPLLSAKINIDGNGNVSVDAKDIIQADIDGLGNVYYRGNPELEVEIYGLGEVVKD